MKYLYSLLWLCTVFFFSCNGGLPDAEETEGEIEIFPDYKGVAVPCNIAPLNFKLKEPCEAIALFSGKDQQIRVDSDNGSFQIPEKKWRRLLDASVGGNLTVGIYICKDDRWFRYPPFSIQVIKDKIDPYLVYRRIAPGYRMWNRMGIYQRCLEDFTEETFLDNKQTNNNCMNCHSFCMQNPDRMLFHQRALHAGTYILTDGDIEKLDTKTERTISALVYPAWHPSGRYVAFSTNDTKQDFHLSDANRVEVFDNRSDVVVYDVEKHEIVTAPHLSSEENMETFPAFSSDGRRLYFCSAPACRMPESYREIRYNLQSIAFDPEKRSFGQTIDTLYNANEEGRSAKLPRVSPDGRFLMYTVSDYGNFSIWHKDADLRLLDMLTGKTDSLLQVNSNDVESYHSWSSNSRWFVFSSRRDDGLYTRPYICYLGANGVPGKPFLLPQKETDYYERSLFSFNIPELMAMFKEVADVQTADMLNLPVPKANFHVEKEPSSEIQKEMVQSFADRAAKVHSHMVSSDEDNMLLITNDGRKAALDQRLLNPDLPDFEESKVNHCVRNVVDIWRRTAEQKSAQLVFCDLSTPHHDGKFNVYDDLKAKLVRMGVPETEIAFIHDAKTEAQKAALFTNVRSGNVRILLGSTAKMGAGTNVQKRLIAEHHLDIPWRPSDIEQREGRILRQGNENSKVDIFRYVTENTFDSYMWQTIESKQKFISQIMTSKSPVRSCEDVDETALSYAEIKALATGNPYIREKMDLEIEVSRLKLVKANYLSQKYMLEDSLLKHYPREIRLTQERINGYEMDIALYGRHKSEDFPGMLLYGTHYEEKKEAGTAILEACKAMTSPEPKEVGSYRGFTLLLSYDIVAKVFRMTLRGELSHTVELGSDIHGNIQRMENMLESLPSRLSACEKALATLKEQMDNAKAEVKKPFEQEHELSEKAARLAELNALLNMDKRENAALDAEPEHTEIETVKAFCKER